MYEFLKEKMTLKDCTIFLEAVSKEMKEKGQREMWKQYSNVLYKLNSCGAIQKKQKKIICRRKKNKKDLQR